MIFNLTENSQSSLPKKDSTSQDIRAVQRHCVLAPGLTRKEGTSLRAHPTIYITLKVGCSLRAVGTSSCRSNLILLGLIQPRLCFYAGKMLFPDTGRTSTDFAVSRSMFTKQRWTIRQVMPIARQNVHEYPQHMCRRPLRKQ